MYTKNTIWFIATCLPALTACKPLQTNKDSKTKSLDNMTSATVTVNSCGNPNIGPTFPAYANCFVFASEQTEVKRAAVGAFGAVPDGIRRGFCTGMQGKIIIDSARAAQICASTAGTDAVTKENKKTGFLACPGTQNKPEFYIEENPQAIRHSMVRLLSYTYFSAQKALEAFKANLSPESADKVTKSLSAERQRLADLANAFKAEANLTDLQISEEEFQQLIFAESMDSFYCSPESSARMQTFPNTLRKFSDTFGKFYGKPWWQT